MCKVMEDMRDKAREEGREEGRKEGREEGMDLFVDLIRKLTELGRTKDAERVFTDANYRTQLFAEFSLQ